MNSKFSILFLKNFLPALKPGGKIAILTFHSGEDRRVKKSFQKFFREGISARYLLLLFVHR
ncbi:MAG: 16S rRNA (cytosine(1402)-N(4))-methyltransferase [Bacteroidia bacterium]